MIPGLKPITNKKQLVSLPKTFHLDIPDDLTDVVMDCKTNEDVALVSPEWMVRICKELIDFVAPVLHFYTYTMGNPEPTNRIMEQL